MVPDMNKNILEELQALVYERQKTRQEGSYITYLLDKGPDKVCTKVMEELAELILATKNKNSQKIVAEAADLYFHLTVLLSQHEVDYQELYTELENRRGS